MKPILRYNGGKRNELKYIKQFIPNFQGRFIEPFFGGGALFFDLEKENSIINDINFYLIKFYMDYSNNYHLFNAEINRFKNEYMFNVKNDLMSENKILYKKIVDLFNKKDFSFYSYMTVYAILNKLCFGTSFRFNKKRLFNNSFNFNKNFNTDIFSLESAKLLKNTDIYNLDYEQIFDIAKKDDFVFIDPPYDSVFTLYGNEKDFKKEQQIILANNFKKLKSKAMIVINKTDFIYELYKDYIVFEYDKTYSINVKNNNNKYAKHLIITNY